MANGVQFPGENVRQWTLLGGGKGGAVGGRRGTMKGTLFWGSSLNAWISCSSRKYIPYPAIRGHFRLLYPFLRRFLCLFCKKPVSFSGSVHFFFGLACFRVLCARKYVSSGLFTRRKGSGYEVLEGVREFHIDILLVSGLHDCFKIGFKI